MSQTSASPKPSAASLEAELQRIKMEIAEYPGPIAGCDAQFNHLLAERQRILDALGKFREGND